MNCTFPYTRARWELLNPALMVRNLWLRRELVIQLTWREVLGRYKSTTLGMLWPLINPLVLLAVYSFVFSGIFKARWILSRTDSHLEYALTLFSGMIFFTIFSETVTFSSQVVVVNSNYVKRVVFPLEILPLAQLAAALFHALLAMLIWLAGMLLFVGLPPATAMYYPLVLFILCAFTLGIAWTVSSIGVFMRDIGQGVGVVVQILFFCSAVFFSVHDVPGKLSWLVSYNPLAMLMENVRRTLIWGLPPEWKQLGWIALLAIVIMQGGYYCFMRSKRAFADVL